MRKIWDWSLVEVCPCCKKFYFNMDKHLKRVDVSDRRRAGDRRKLDLRRITERTLYFYTNKPTGKYLDKDGFMLPDRRSHKSRRYPGDRRKV